jgi:hypothetical protein
LIRKGKAIVELLDGLIVGGYITEKLIKSMISLLTPFKPDHSIRLILKILLKKTALVSKEIRAV